MNAAGGNGYEVLDAIAARLHVRVRPAAMLMDGKELDRMCKFQLQGRAAECATDGSILYLEMRAKSPIVFALGGPDRWGILADQPIDAIEGVTIYAKTAWRLAVAEWLSSPSNRTLVSDLGLRAGEVVVVALNGLDATLESDSPETSWRRIQGIGSIADCLGQHAVGVGDISGSFDQFNPVLPSEFADLTPLAKVWAQPDDHIREELIIAASAGSLRDLVRSVSPHLVRIDHLLDQQEEPLPDDLIWLQWLAIAAVEARLELERRKLLHG